MIRLAADYLSEELKTEVRIRGFDLSIFRGLVIEEISLLDRNRETLFSAHELGAIPGFIKFSDKKLNIRKIYIDRGIVQLLTHKGDSALNLQFIIDYFAGTDSAPPADTTTAPPWDITFSTVTLRDTRFHMQDFNEPLAEAGMDFTNLDISHINLELTDIDFDADTIRCNIAHLSARDRCGFNLHNLSGEFAVSPAFLKARNLKIVTENSDLALSFEFLYPSWNAYNEFLTDVKINAKIEPGYLNLMDIGYFAPDLLVMNDRIRLSGDFEGPVSNLRARNLRFAFGRNSFFYGNILAVGLPDIERTFIDLNIKSMNVNKQDIESIRIPGDVRTLELPGMLANIGTISLSGSFTGFYDDFVARTSIHTNIGRVKSDLTMKSDRNRHITSYNGQVDVTAFDIGKLTDAGPMVGSITARGAVSGSGFSVDKAAIEMNLRVDSIELNQYVYRNLNIEGNLSEKKFGGQLNITDPNLRMNFVGLVDLSDSIPVFDFSAKVYHAMLFKLNLLDRDSLENFSGSIKADFTGNKPDNLDGSISLYNAVYAEGQKSITLNRLSLLSKQDTASGKSYHLQSDFLDADITGSFSFSDLVPSLSVYIRNYLASFQLKDSMRVADPKFSDQSVNFNIRIKETDEVTDIFLPILRIAPSTSLSGFYDEKKGTVRIRGQSPALFISGIELSDWSIDAESRNDNLQVRTGCRSVYLKRASKDDSLEVKIDTFSLVTNLRYDTVYYEIGWTDMGNHSNMDGYVSFLRSPVIDIHFDRFNVFLNNRFWSVDPSNLISIDSTAIHLNKVDFGSGDQFARFNGRVSAADGDTLYASFNKLDISTVDRLIGSSGLDFDGILSGNAKITKPYENISLITELKIDKFKFNRESLGDAICQVSYDSKNARFDILTQIAYTGNIGTNIPFSLKGNLWIEEPNPRIDFTVVLKNLNLRIISPFVESFMSGVNGLASGEVKVQGIVNKPNIRGQIKLMRTEFKIDYLNVPYSFADIITIDSNAFHFRDIVLFDSLGHKAMLNGAIRHNYFSDLRLDLSIDMNDFAAFNNTRAQNSIFYGKARGTGNVSITGPVDNIRINVKATNGGDTRVSIPIDLTQDVGQVDYILFINKSTDTLGEVQTIRPANQEGLTLDLGMRVNTDAEVEVFLPDQLGKLTASGTGDLLMSMSPTTPFTLSGTYRIAKGSFLFQFKNYLRLPMQIREGSKISWTGDPTDANISVSAVYKTKAPLKGISSYQEEQGIRIPVECIIRLGGKLMDPTISFAIEMPNVEEAIKTQVYAAIDTNNQIVMNEQTLSLLILNQFKPIVPTSSTVDLGATSMSLVTNQINSWMSGLTQNVNVNMNYQPATSSTQQEFDVGISTQLFDDRLLIDGTFGVNSYTNTSIKQSSTIVGDINIEYILTKNRRWRLRAFNRTNTLNILNNNAPYTQGVGFKYQRDFSNFKEIFTFSKSASKK